MMSTEIRLRDGERIEVGSEYEGSEWVGFNIHDGVLTLYGCSRLERRTSDGVPVRVRNIRSLPLGVVADIVTENAPVPPETKP